MAVLSGGRSSEREASLGSGAAVCEGLEAAGHVLIPIDIGLDGVWRRNGRAMAVELEGGLQGVDVDSFPRPVPSSLDTSAATPKDSTASR